MNLLNWRARNVRVIRGQSADNSRTADVRTSVTQRDGVTNCYEDFRKATPNLLGSRRAFRKTIDGN